MSETVENLVEEIEYEIEDATVIPAPIDPTLTIAGEAADAKATGDRIAAALDGATVNGKQAVNKAFTVYAVDILMSNAQGAQTVAEAITAATSVTAANVMYDTTGMISTKDALDDIYTKLDSELSESDIDDIFDSVFGEDDD